MGIPEAIRKLDVLVEAAIDSVPLCPGRERMHELIRHEASRFLPEKLARRAA
jgi:geranylgeranyl diphosphate synthase type II